MSIRLQNFMPFMYGHDGKMNYRATATLSAFLGVIGGAIAVWRAGFEATENKEHDWYVASDIAHNVAGGIVLATLGVVVYQLGTLPVKLKEYRDTAAYRAALSRLDEQGEIDLEGVDPEGETAGVVYHNHNGPTEEPIADTNQSWFACSASSVDPRQLFQPFTHQKAGAWFLIVSAATSVIAIYETIGFHKMLDGFLHNPFMHYAALTVLTGVVAGIVGLMGVGVAALGSTIYDSYVNSASGLGEYQPVTGFASSSWCCLPWCTSSPQREITQGRDPILADHNDHLLPDGGDQDGTYEPVSNLGAGASV